MKKNWDQMTPDERTRELHRDATLRQSRWIKLVATLSATRFADMTPIQQDMIRFLKVAP